VPVSNGGWRAQATRAVCHCCCAKVLLKSPLTMRYWQADTISANLVTWNGCECWTHHRGLHWRLPLLHSLTDLQSTNCELYLSDPDITAATIGTAVMPPLVIMMVKHHHWHRIQGFRQFNELGLLTAPNKKGKNNVQKASKLLALLQIPLGELKSLPVQSSSWWGGDRCPHPKTPSLLSVP